MVHDAPPEDLPPTSLPPRRGTGLMVWRLALIVAACTHGPAHAEPQARGRPSAASEARTVADVPASPSSLPASTSPPSERPVPQAAGLAYVERVLGDADPDAPLPMIVAIHGLGDRPENFTHVFDGLEVRARVVLFRGLTQTPSGGWSWFPIRVRDHDVEQLSEGIASAAARLAEAIEVVAHDRPTIGKPILTGFSQGGMLSFAIAVHHPEVVAEAYPIGGWLPPPLWPGEGDRRPDSPRIYALHGSADPVVRFGPTRRSVEHLRSSGFDAQLRTFEGVRHAIPPAMRQVLFAQLSRALARVTAPASPTG